VANSCFNIVLYLHSAAGITTPSISLLTITYDFAGDPQDEIYLCSVYWYSRKVDGTICEETYTILPSSNTAIYKDNVSVCREPKQITADENGRVEVDLIENVNMVTNAGLPTHYYVKRGGIEIAKIAVPVLPGALLWDILAT
jgi:hypothetical protein